MARTAEQRQQDWAKYYASHKEELKAKRTIKADGLTEEQCELAKAERKAINKAYYEKNKARLFARIAERRDERLVVQAEYRINNADKVRARHLRYYTTNREDILRRQKEYIAQHPENKKEAQARYTIKYPHKKNAKENKRRASKLNATPEWANEFFIKEAYHLAKLREKVLGGKWHVDHIVPLRSKLVCGLHVEHNLQVIPSVHNISKGNRHWPEMPS